MSERKLDQPLEHSKTLKSGVEFEGIFALLPRCSKPTGKYFGGTSTISTEVLIGFNVGANHMSALTLPKAKVKTQIYGYLSLIRERLSRRPPVECGHNQSQQNDTRRTVWKRICRCDI